MDINITQEIIPPEKHYLRSESYWLKQMICEKRRSK